MCSDFISLTLVKNKSQSKGFTLIELLIVLLIIGILAAISFPNLLAQVGKARETEAKTNLSSLGQSQQAYFLEKATFADKISKLSINLPATGSYNFPDPTTADSSLVKHFATNPAALNESTRNYGMGVYFFLSDFGIILCQSSDIGGTVEAPNTYADVCIGGEEVR